MEEIQTLMQVRRENNLTSRQLADAAGIPLRVEYLAEIGGLVEEMEAGLLLEAISKLTSKCIVTFPDGTTRQEILPRPNYSVRSRITLPDRYEMREVLQRDSSLSPLGFPDRKSTRL